VLRLGQAVHTPPKALIIYLLAVVTFWKARFCYFVLIYDTVVPCETSGLRRGVVQGLHSSRILHALGW
jgi:hypothetical protein